LKIQEQKNILWCKIYRRVDSPSFWRILVVCLPILGVDTANGLISVVRVVCYPLRHRGVD